MTLRWEWARTAPVPLTKPPSRPPRNVPRIKPAPKGCLMAPVLVLLGFGVVAGVAWLARPAAVTGDLSALLGLGAVALYAVTGAMRGAR